MVRLRILQIEDSESDAVLIVRLLDGAGYEVPLERVETEGQLRLALDRQSWDAIACGCTLRDVEPLRALKVLQSSGFDIPFIVIARAMEEETAALLMKSGAHDYVMRENPARLAPAIEREIKVATSRRQSREAVEALRTSQERLALALAASNMGVWEWNLRTNAVHWSDECYRIAGQKDFDGTLENFLKLVDPEDAGRIQRAAESAAQGNGVFGIEFRIRRDDQVRWLSNFGKVKYDDHGHPAFLIGTVEDITTRKEDQDSLRQANQRLEELNANYRSLLGQLHSIREEERAHLSREIHDYLGQILTSLKLNLYSAEQSLSCGEIESGLTRIREAAGKIDGLMEAVRDIATELRPPLLDQVGLAAALRWQAQLLEKQHGLQILLDLPALEPAMSELQKISIFRIAQESLTNIIRHTGSKSAQISLREDADSLHLTIQDFGEGIEADSLASHSMGIFGMKERARLIYASFSIESNPEHGTLVEVVVPKSPVGGGPSE